MGKEIIAKETYKLDLGTDEEIKNFLKAEGLTNVNPEDVRSRICEVLYKAVCEAKEEYKK